MLSKKRKWRSGETSGKRKRNPLLSESSPASSSSFDTNGKTFTEATKSPGKGKVNEKGRFLVITDQEFSHYCSTMNERSGTDKLIDESEDRTNDLPLLHSDTDRHHHSLSQNLLDSQNPILRCTRSSVKTRSISTVETTSHTFGDRKVAGSTTDGAFGVWNSRLKVADNVRHKSDVSSLMPIREDFSTENVPKGPAMEEIPMAFAIGVERPEENAFHLKVEMPEESPCHFTQTFSFGLSHMANMCDLDSVKNEVESPAVGTVQGYRVKKELECVLRSIIEKYGDIAAKFILESQKNRSSVLEDICEIVQLLQSKRLTEISRKDIETFLSQVCDFGKAGMKVEWLQNRLESVLDAKCLLKQMPTLKERRDKNGAVVTELKTKLKHYEAQLIELKEKRDKDAEHIIELKRNLDYYDAEMQKLQEWTNSTTKDLDTEEGETETIRQIVSCARNKVVSFVEHSLLDGLL